ncbi:hypothetical protein mRhiFer1_009900 [Rhinolophus ferrumequinum]|uniref:Uncharacterized protein n=1 Tax=Rhinolophus ferrumequinum TaxID=59479 RepID=A0A7J7YJ36_RHIFE|nr:hypothetical protein mRhiFer1_009900 [Rhinolophus ferrumequinum]
MSASGPIRSQIMGTRCKKRNIFRVKKGEKMIRPACPSISLSGRVPNANTLQAHLSAASTGPPVCLLQKQTCATHTGHQTFHFKCLLGPYMFDRSCSLFPAASKTVVWSVSTSALRTWGGVILCGGADLGMAGRSAAALASTP